MGMGTQGKVFHENHSLLQKDKTMLTAHLVKQVTEQFVMKLSKLRGTTSLVSSITDSRI